MKDIISKPFRTAAVIGTFGILAACGGSSSGGSGPFPPDPPPPPPMAEFEDNFGDKFGETFRLTTVDEPIDPVDGDIIALDITADPIDVPDP